MKSGGGIAAAAAGLAVLCSGGNALRPPLMMPRRLLLPAAAPRMTDPSSSVGGSSATQRLKEVLASTAFRKTLAPMAVSGALLGPNLDNYHSAFGVLRYEHPITIALGDITLVTTDWWVPPLFAIAGIGIGSLYLIFDAVFDTPLEQRSPSWPAVFSCISLFSLQYYLSGVLHAADVPLQALVAALALPMILGFIGFDGTKAGLLISALTAVLGPAIEVALINLFHLYSYAGAEFYGIDSWIPIVYFLGGPAVGNLARAFNQLFEQEVPPQP